MLNLQEALIFLVDILRITDVQIKLKQDSFKLLREILYKYLHVEPFQNIINLSTKSEDRHLPSFQEIKEDIFEGRGGRCYVANQFMKELLNSIGYDVYYCACAVMVAEDIGNHLCTLVRDLTKPGDLHLIDVGLGHATWDPIPLNFEVESPVYQVGFLYFKFVREGDVITRMHKHDKKYKFPVNIDSKAWHEFGKMTTIPREIHYFKQVLTAMYTIPGAYTSPFLQELTCVTFENGKIIAIKDATLLFENDDHQLEVKQLTTCEELISTISAYFPRFNRDMIESAIRASPKCSKNILP